MHINKVSSTQLSWLSILMLNWEDSSSSSIMYIYILKTIKNATGTSAVHAMMSLAPTFGTKLFR